MLNSYFKGWSLPSHTESLGTTIFDGVQPSINAVAKLNLFTITSAGTAHTPTVMKALGYSTTTAAAASGATTIAVAALAFDPVQTLAANDYIAVQLASGEYFFAIVTNVSTLTLTIAALPEAVLSGAKVWYFGAAADTGHHIMRPPASATTSLSAPAPAAITDSSYSFASGGIRYESNGLGRPMLILNANATAASTHVAMAGTYYRH